MRFWEKNAFVRILLTAIFIILFVGNSLDFGDYIYALKVKESEYTVGLNYEGSMRNSRFWKYNSFFKFLI